jgi:hypothetical protein
MSCTTYLRERWNAPAARGKNSGRPGPHGSGLSLAGKLVRSGPSRLLPRALHCLFRKAEEVGFDGSGGNIRHVRIVRIARRSGMLPNPPPIRTNVLEPVCPAQTRTERGCGIFTANLDAGSLKGNEQIAGLQWLPCSTKRVNRDLLGCSQRPTPSRLGTFSNGSRGLGRRCRRPCRGLNARNFRVHRDKLRPAFRVSKGCVALCDCFGQDMVRDRGHP